MTFADTTSSLSWNFTLYDPFIISYLDDAHYELLPTQARTGHVRLPVERIRADEIEFTNYGEIVPADFTPQIRKPTPAEYYTSSITRAPMSLCHGDASAPPSRAKCRSANNSSGAKATEYCKSSHLQSPTESPPPVPKRGASHSPHLPAESSRLPRPGARSRSADQTRRQTTDNHSGAKASDNQLKLINGVSKLDERTTPFESLLAVLASLRNSSRCVTMRSEMQSYREELSSTLLAMSLTRDSCLAMRHSSAFCCSAHSTWYRFRLRLRSRVLAEPVPHSPPSYCLPLLIELLHPCMELQSPTDLDSLQRPLDSKARSIRERASNALHTIVHASYDEEQCRRESRVLRLLEQIRSYCDELRCRHQRRRRDTLQFDQYPIPAIASLMKMSFDEEHRQAITTLGGLHAIAELLILEWHSSRRRFRQNNTASPDKPEIVNGVVLRKKSKFEAQDEMSDQGACALSNTYDADSSQCPSEFQYDCDESNTIICRYACMALTNLTFGDSQNKGLICSLVTCLSLIVRLVEYQQEDLAQVAASVLRNLSWRADEQSKIALRSVDSVRILIRSALHVKQEATLKAILSALWNLTAHSTANKADVCQTDGALKFLVATLSYRGSVGINCSKSSQHRAICIVENGGGILRNVSSHVAIHEKYRQILRDCGCLQLLLIHLRSPSLTVVSNACGTLWNLSARNAHDQQLLWDLGAVPMLRNLLHSKHHMISTGSAAALKNLMSFKPEISVIDGKRHTNFQARRLKQLYDELDREELTEMSEAPEASTPANPTLEDYEFEDLDYRSEETRSDLTSEVQSESNSCLGNIKDASELLESEQVSSPEEKRHSRSPSPTPTEKKVKEFCNANFPRIDDSPEPTLGCLNFAIGGLHYAMGAYGVAPQSYCEESLVPNENTYTPESTLTRQNNTFPRRPQQQPRQWQDTDRQNSASDVVTVVESSQASSSPSYSIEGFETVPKDYRTTEATSNECSQQRYLWPVSGKIDALRGATCASLRLYSNKLLATAEQAKECESSAHGKRSLVSSGSSLDPVDEVPEEQENIIVITDESSLFKRESSDERKQRRSKCRFIKSKKVSVASRRSKMRKIRRFNSDTTLYSRKRIELRKRFPVAKFRSTGNLSTLPGDATFTVSTESSVSSSKQRVEKHRSRIVNAKECLQNEYDVADTTRTLTCDWKVVKLNFANASREERIRTMDDLDDFPENVDVDTVSACPRQLSLSSKINVPLELDIDDEPPPGQGTDISLVMNSEISPTDRNCRETDLVDENGGSRNEPTSIATNLEIDELFDDLKPKRESMRESFRFALDDGLLESFDFSNDVALVCGALTETKDDDEEPKLESTKPSRKIGPRITKPLDTPEVTSQPILRGGKKKYGISASVATKRAQIPQPEKQKPPPVPIRGGSRPTPRQPYDVVAPSKELSQEASVNDAKKVVKPSSRPPGVPSKIAIPSLKPPKNPVSSTRSYQKLVESTKASRAAQKPTPPVRSTVAKVSRTMKPSQDPPPPPLQRSVELKSEFRSSSTPASKRPSRLLSPKAANDSPRCSSMSSSSDGSAPPTRLLSSCASEALRKQHTNPKCPMYGGRSPSGNSTPDAVTQIAAPSPTSADTPIVRHSSDAKRPPENHQVRPSQSRNAYSKSHRASYPLTPVKGQRIVTVRIPQRKQEPVSFDAPPKNSPSAVVLPFRQNVAERKTLSPMSPVANPHPNGLSPISIDTASTRTSRLPSPVSPPAPNKQITKPPIVSPKPSKIQMLLSRKSKLSQPSAKPFSVNGHVETGKSSAAKKPVEKRLEKISENGPLRYDVNEVSSEKPTTKTDMLLARMRGLRLSQEQKPVQPKIRNIETSI